MIKPGRFCRRAVTCQPSTLLLKNAIATRLDEGIALKLQTLADRRDSGIADVHVRMVLRKVFIHQIRLQVA